MNIKKYFWILPFLLFFFGYVSTRYIFYVSEIAVPNVIGKKLVDGLSTFSSVGINAKLLREKEDYDMEEGIILDQSPSAGTKIRPTYPVRITVSKKPDPRRAPNYMGKRGVEVERVASKSLVKTKIFKVNSDYPAEYCFAQSPRANEEVRDYIVSYVSSKEKSYGVVPSLVGENASDVQNYLLKNGVRVDLYHQSDVSDGHFCKKCRVVEQKPAAGSIVKMDKDARVQLLVH